VFDLFQHLVRPSVLQVDLVQRRDDRQVVLESRQGVGHRLRLDALKGVHQQQSTFATHQRPRHLVGKIHVSGRVDQIQLVCLAAPGVAQPHRAGLDRDPAGSLQFHVVQQLISHLALADRAGVFQHSIG